MALRSIGLAEMSLERSSPIVTLGRQSDSAEFIEKHKPKPGPVLSESRDIVKTFM
jgi:hypothetical protein